MTELSDVINIMNFAYEHGLMYAVSGAAGRKDDSLVYEEHIRYLTGEAMPECDALKYSFLMKETGRTVPCLELPGLEFELDRLRDSQRQYHDTIAKCNRETPCFYGCAREVGVLWRKKYKAAAHVFTIISQMRRYGSFL